MPAAELQGRERAQVCRWAVGGLSRGRLGLAAEGWNSGWLVPGDSLNPMSGFGPDDGTLLYWTLD